MAATYTYDPWGNITSSTGALATTNPWHYAGSYTDAATGYLKLGARYYNTTTGRFTQPDPSGKEANTYNYATCNPTNNTDPTGLLSPCTSLAIQGVVYGLGSLVTGGLAVGATGTIFGAPAGAVLGYASWSLAAGGFLVGSQALLCL